MMYQRKLFLFCMIFAANTAFCQYSPKIIRQSTINKTDPLGTQPFFSNPFLFNKIIPANFSTCQLGFFCKQEWKFESKTKLPFKFRVGDLKYCDWLEGKRNTVMLTSY